VNRQTDPNHTAQVFPGHQAATQLYASQNRAELKKLKAVPQAQARNRYLLLVDLRGVHDFPALQTGYRTELPRFSGGAAIRVVYVKRGESARHFVVGGQRKKKR
jgi:hypothetical protein